jgi:cysteinyl-tRNA synthetase
MLRLYNTLTRKVEEFTPLRKDWVGYYSCGPTVYDFAHIGHARTYIFADTLGRTLSFLGYKVKRVMNITDVGHLTSDSDSGEDKMEKGAKRENKSVWDIAQFYTDDFMKMLKDLNIEKPEIICKATDYIPQMISLVKQLEQKGFTYTVDDGVYFDTTKLSDYGKLTGQTFEELVKGLKAGARIEVVAGKKHPTDFALWKFSYPKGRPFDSTCDASTAKRQMQWDSPWGLGFPGWHIECSAMSMEFLGETIDIHTGGVDHIPIHHTNEIAQSEAATGKPFVRCWLHGEHLLIDGQKMSKSLKNFYRLSDIIQKGFDPLSLKYLFFSASYRQQLNFTWKALESAARALKNLHSRVKEMEKANDRENEKQNTHTPNEFTSQFKDAISDDLNMAKALSVVWNVVKSSLSNRTKLAFLHEVDKVLGFGFKNQQENTHRFEAPAEITLLVEKRDRLRTEGKWEEADEVRNQIEKLGFALKDTKNGAQVQKK